MAVLTANNVGKSFGADDIFEGVTVEIPHGAKIALVGPNGAGKTTLLRILIGLDEPTAGVVSHARADHRLPAAAPGADRRIPLWDEMMTAFADLRRREAKLDALAKQMGDSSRADADEIVRRMAQMEPV